LLIKNLSSLPTINNSIFINVGNVNKWNSGVINRNWTREFYWLSPEIDTGIFELYRAGVPAEILFKAGYEYTELLNVGYSHNDLVSAGFKK